MIVLPTIAGSVSSGSVVKVSGLTGGSVRGMSYKRSDGELLRPSLVLIDDPQTDATARSATQCEQRVRLLAGAVLGMAGPGKRMAGVMACTVVVPGDMADRILDATKHPEWQGTRKKLLYSFPTNMALWEENHRVRSINIARGDKGVAGNEHYRHRQKAMDEGAVPAWVHRFHRPDDSQGIPGEISAIQHCMNLYFQDAEAFWSEYQNDPKAIKNDSEWPTADKIAARSNALKRGDIPTACNHLTLYIDVHDRLLYWMLCAWQDDFTGYVIDYGPYPDQGKRYFSLTNATKTLARACQGAGRDGAIYAGLKAVCDAMLPRRWKRDDGAELQIALAMIDSSWGEQTGTVHKFVREYPSSILYPAKGVGLGAAGNPWDDRKPQPGERAGHHCRIAPTPNRTARGRHAIIDTNYWKTTVARALMASPGDAGAITLYGMDPDSRVNPSELHRLLADHLTAEKPVETMNVRSGRAVIEWRLLPARPDNHWFDCLVGCAVMASMLGASTVPAAIAPGAEKKPKSKPTYRRSCWTI
jgi:hypothetical protein